MYVGKRSCYGLVACVRMQTSFRVGRTGPVHVLFIIRSSVKIKRRRGFKFKSPGTGKAWLACAYFAYIIITHSPFNCGVIERPAYTIRYWFHAEFRRVLIYLTLNPYVCNCHCTFDCYHSRLQLSMIKSYCLIAGEKMC